MRTLDELAAAHREYLAKVQACEHEWGPADPIGPSLGLKCTKCSVYELPWFRGEASRLRQAIALAEELTREEQEYDVWIPACRWCHSEHSIDGEHFVHKPDCKWQQFRDLVSNAGGGGS